MAVVSAEYVGSSATLRTSCADLVETKENVFSADGSLASEFHFAEAADFKAEMAARDEELARASRDRLESQFFRLAFRQD